MPAVLLQPQRDHEGGRSIWSRPGLAKCHVALAEELGHAGPPHLQGAALGRIQHQETPQDVFAVRGHVEGDTVLATQHTLPQLLVGGAEACRSERSLALPQSLRAASLLGGAALPGQGCQGARAEASDYVPGICHPLVPWVGSSLCNFRHGATEQSEKKRRFAQRDGRSVISINKINK